MGQVRIEGPVRRTLDVLSVLDLALPLSRDYIFLCTLATLRFKGVINKRLLATFTVRTPII